MTQSTSAAGGDRQPPLAQDLDAVQVRYTWKFGEAGKGPVSSGPTLEPEGAVDGEAEVELAPEEAELERLRAQVRHYATALEDIVTLALSSADYKERAIMMHRRAVAAFSGIGARPGIGGR